MNAGWCTNVPFCLAFHPHTPFVFLLSDVNLASQHCYHSLRTLHYMFMKVQCCPSRNLHFPMFFFHISKAFTKLQCLFFLNTQYYITGGHFLVIYADTYLPNNLILYCCSIWKKQFGTKGNDRIRWLNSPNVYQKVEILETGTSDPRKITKVETITFSGNQK